MKPRIYTVGYGTLPADSFGGLLGDYGVSTLYDIRSHRRSRIPHYNAGPLSRWVPDDHKIRYEWLTELGGWSERDLAYLDEMDAIGIDIRPYTHGRFPMQYISQRTRPGFGMTNIGDMDYAYYTTRLEYWSVGITTLLQAVTAGVVPAIMCLEREYTQCHREHVADSLIWLRNNYDVGDYEVWHIGTSYEVNHERVMRPMSQRWLPQITDRWRERCDGLWPAKDTVWQGEPAEQLRMGDKDYGFDQPWEMS